MRNLAGVANSRSEMARPGASPQFAKFMRFNGFHELHVPTEGIPRRIDAEKHHAYVPLVVAPLQPSQPVADIVESLIYQRNVVRWHICALRACPQFPEGTLRRFVLAGGRLGKAVNDTAAPSRHRMRDVGRPSDGMMEHKKARSRSCGPSTGQSLNL